MGRVAAKDEPQRPSMTATPRRMGPRRRAKRTLLVRTRTTTVGMEARFKASPCMTTTGRSSPGLDPNAARVLANPAFYSVTTLYYPRVLLDATSVTA